MQGGAPGRSPVLADTSALFSLIYTRDTHHIRVRQALETLAVERRLLHTTNYIVAEAHALFLNRLGRDIGERFLRETLRGDIAVVQALPDDERRAREIIFAYTDKDFSLTDALSFAVMERQGIRDAFTLDSHFTQFGFTAYPRTG